MGMLLANRGCVFDGRRINARICGRNKAEIVLAFIPPSSSPSLRLISGVAEFFFSAKLSKKARQPQKCI
jgi:hypothetical protein